MEQEITSNRLFELTNLELKLVNILKDNQQSWVNCYKLMKEVELKALYSPMYNSYTAWVKALAKKAGISVSILWRRKKAGKFYENYRQSAEKRGCSMPKLEEINVSPENINLVEKISGDNIEAADQLMKKVLCNDISRSDLEKTWAAVKEDRERKGQQVVKKTRFDKPLSTSDAVISATNILQAFSQDRTWLSTIGNGFDVGMKQTGQKYKVLSEFAVRSKVIGYPQRLDAMVLESLTTGQPYNLSLHGIEIKVDSYDLLNDQKMAEYTDFCDYFWLAVPERLFDAAEKIRLPEWGILCLSEDLKISVACPAKRMEAAMREESLMQACACLM